MADTLAERLLGAVSKCDEGLGGYEGNTVDDIIRYESGEMDEEEVVDFFQKLVTSGLAWRLQGHYGRTAMGLIKAGLIHESVEARKLHKRLSENVVPPPFFDKEGNEGEAVANAEYAKAQKIGKDQMGVHIVPPEDDVEIPEPEEGKDE